jgi:hypothetical protein
MVLPYLKVFLYNYVVLIILCECFGLFLKLRIFLLDYIFLRYITFGIIALSWAKKRLRKFIYLFFADFLREKRRATHFRLNCETL